MGHKTQDRYAQAFLFPVQSQSIMRYGLDS